jgi:hypothetical protein
MDAERFDRLSRAVVGRASRRRSLAMLIGLLALGHGGGPAVAGKHHRHGQHKRRQRQRRRADGTSPKCVDLLGPCGDFPRSPCCQGLTCRDGGCDVVCTTDEECEDAWGPGPQVQCDVAAQSCQSIVCDPTGHTEVPPCRNACCWGPADPIPRCCMSGEVCNIYGACVRPDKGAAAP